MAFEAGAIKGTLELDDKPFSQGLARAEGQADKSGNNIAGFFGSVGKMAALAGAAVVAAGGALATAAISQASQFEKYETSLKVMLGSSELAKARMAELSDLAKTTPFELPQVVELGNQLQALGRYSKENVIVLGDLASAAGKPIEQVAGAYAKLASGQKGVAVDMFRDLLITTDDWVKATGKGVNKTGELMATTEEMLAVLPKILDTKGYSGMMEEQAKTFEGKMSNLMDTFNGKLREIGAKLLPIIKPIIDQITTLLGSIDLDGFFNGLGQIVGYFRELYELVVASPIVQSIFDIFNSGSDSQLGGLIDQLNTGFSTLIGSILTLGQSLIAFLQGEAVQGFITVMQGIFMTILTNIWTAFQTFVGVLVNQVWPAIQRLVEALKPVLDVILPILAALIGGVILVITKFWEILSAGLTPAIQFFGTVIQIVIDVITLAVKWLGYIISAFQTLAAIVVFVMQQIWNTVKPTFESIAAFISERVEQIKRVFGPIVDAVATAFNAVRSTISGAFESAVGTVRGVINSLIGMINSVINGINDVIRGANSVPGVNIGYVGKIPYLAKGIQDFAGGLAVVGEQGPELVNLPKGADVISNSDSAAMLSGGGGGPVINLTIPMDGAIISDPEFADNVATQIGDKIIDSLMLNMRH